jgi:uncharacterized protein YmfQ (DUF2313 family)
MAVSTPLSHGAETGTVAAVEPFVSDVRREWDWVKPGVEEILRNAKTLTYRAEDVYAACVNGQAVLWVTSEGFVVSTTEVDNFTGKKTMFLWLAWAKEKGNSLVSRYQSFFERVAREAGYSYLETRSPFLGLMSHLETNGWTVDTVVYTRAI